jgi:hypothetical protein
MDLTGTTGLLFPSAMMDQRGEDGGEGRRPQGSTVCALWQAPKDLVHVLTIYLFLASEVYFLFINSEILVIDLLQ